MRLGWQKRIGPMVLALNMFCALSFADEMRVPSAPVQTAVPLERALYDAIERFVLRFDEGRVRFRYYDRDASLATRSLVFSEYLGNLQMFSLVPQDEVSCLLTLQRRPPEDDTDAARLPSGRLSLSDPCYPRSGRSNGLEPGAWSLEERDPPSEDPGRDGPIGRSDGGGVGGGGVGRGSRP